MEQERQAGFHDQSDMANEFRRLCGLTPGQFLQRSIAHSSKTVAQGVATIGRMHSTRRKAWPD